MAKVPRESKKRQKKRKRSDRKGERSTKPKVEYLDEPLERLTKHNYIRLKQEPVRRSRGRQPAAIFEVNPLYLQHLVNPANTICRIY
jgi:hypothetical protein